MTISQLRNPIDSHIVRVVSTRPENLLFVEGPSP